MPDDRPVAIVTGGASGIGRAVAGSLTGRGHAVAVFDLNEAPPGASSPPGLSFHRVDVGDEGAVRAGIRAVLDRHQRIDALVNNAGIMVRKKLGALTLGDWNRVLATNLTGAFLCAREAAEALRARRGSIVNIASTRAHMSEPDTEAYAASKGGLVALTHALALSLGPDVRVNCISPGWIDVDGTPLSREDHAQHPVGRVGVPGDIAELVLWLLSPAAGFVTGAEFVVDGGMTRKMIYVE